MGGDFLNVIERWDSGNSTAAIKLSDNEMVALQAMVIDTIKSSLNGGAKVQDYGYLPVTAQEMFKVYSANEARGDKLFKDKKIIISGTIESISSSIGDVPIVSLKSGDMIRMVHVDFARKYRELAADLNKNQKVSFACVGGTVVIGMPSVKECKPIGAVVAELAKEKMSGLNEFIKNPKKDDNENAQLLAITRLSSKATNDFQSCKPDNLPCIAKQIDAYGKGKDLKVEFQSIKSELGLEAATAN